MATVKLPFGFYDYGTDKGGLVVGRVYEHAKTGKKFRFCQASTTMVGATTNATSATQFDPVVQIGAVTFGLATDDISAGLDATHPFCLGLPTSQCPKSTSSVTYYFWAQVGGWVHTTLTGSTFASVKMNNDDDAAVGDTIILTSSDAAANTVATGTAGVTKKSVGYVLVAVVAATDLVTGVQAIDALS